MRHQIGSGSFLFIFGLIFFAAGMGVGVFGFKALYLSSQAKDWLPVSMTITSTQLDVNTGDDSTTYQVLATYQYDYQGQHYTGDRVTFDSGSDNIGDFHQETHALLRQHLNAEPWTGYINPQQPSHSVLIREIRWGKFAFMMAFPLIFGGAGVGIMLAGRWSSRKAKQKAEFINENPERAWQARKEWRTNRLQCSNKGTMRIAIIMATIWSLVSLPIPFIAFNQLQDDGNYLILLMLLFPVVGIGLIIWAIKSVARWRKYGQTVFIAKPFPAHPGGLVGGTLELQSALNASQLKTRLSCIRKVTSGSGKNRSTRESIIWQDEQVVTLQPGQLQIPFGFKIDGDAAPSDNSNPNNQLLWRVDCSSDVPGVDFSTTFEVPVIEGQADAAVLAAAEKLVSQQKKQAEQSSAWLDTGVEVSHSQGYPSYRFPRGRNKGIAVILMTMGLIFGGVGVAIFSPGNSPFIGSIFGLFGLLMLYASLHSLLYTTELITKPDQLDVISGVFRSNKRQYPAAAIQSLELKTGSSMGNHQYWNLIMKTNGSIASGGYGGFKAAKAKTVKLASDLPSRRSAQAFLDRIKDELNM